MNLSFYQLTEKISHKSVVRTTIIIKSDTYTFEQPIIIGAEYDITDESRRKIRKVNVKGRTSTGVGFKIF